ncbi:MAG: SH3 domain-containing protein [Gammaproteobacteria bacterium]|nr:SH3 domain-containing protein [Gammaproteobacteria bacterium]MBU1724038.1 SH3 domain-containing protein [Gammaproteobacteria bacterium]MBU2006893.1 SH3 domain-containing protein [Gammaproteobacteria bacterium]
MKKPFLIGMSAFALALAVSAASIQPAQAAEVKVYSVTRVPAGQQLNMRSGPGVGNRVVATIPAGGTGVVATGEERKVGRSVWARVYWAGQGGWVNKSYLTTGSPSVPGPPAGTPTPPSSGSGSITLKCAGTEPFWGITITERLLSVDMMDGPKYSVPVTFRQTSANNITIAVIAGADGPNATQTFLQKVPACSDGMSDTNYPYAATAVLNNQKVVSGCCNVQQ